MSFKKEIFLEKNLQNIPCKNEQDLSSSTTSQNISEENIYLWGHLLQPYKKQPQHFI